MSWSDDGVQAELAAAYQESPKGRTWTRRPSRWCCGWMRSPQIQALDRTAPTLPLRPGLAERGSFASLPDLVAAIGRYIDAWNADCQPFSWVKDDDQILVTAASARRP